MSIAITAVPRTVPAMPKREVRKAAPAAARPVAITLTGLTMARLPSSLADAISTTRLHRPGSTEAARGVVSFRLLRLRQRRRLPHGLGCADPRECRKGCSGGCAASVWAFYHRKGG